MPATEPANSVTPLETSFRKQVDTAREALALFHLLLPSSSSSAFRASLNDVVNATVCQGILLSVMAFDASSLGRSEQFPLLHFSCTISGNSTGCLSRYRGFLH